MILLKDCLAVATLDRKALLKGRDILIQGTLIRRIAKNINIENTETEIVEVIDCSNCIVVPGFINTHHHFYQVLTRNIPSVQNAGLFDWLTTLYEIWKRIDEEAVLVSSMAAIGELLKTGCTCTTDHHYLYPGNFSGDLMGIQFEAARRLGIRFSPARGSMSLSRKDGGLPPDSVVQSDKKILEDSLRVIETYHDPGVLSMRKITLAPCSPFSVTRSLMRETVRLAREKKVRLHTHLAETADEDDYCLKILKKRPLSLMEEWGFIGKDVSFAHGIHFTDEELDLLASTGTSIAHCPSSNMRLGSGIARVKEMLERGVNVALGVDGSASNDSSDFLGEMRNALLLQRVRYGAGALGVEEVFRMAVENGARLLGYEKIGKIREGWGADLAVFNLNQLGYAGALSDPQAALLFAGDSHQTEYTIVNGEVAVRKGILAGVDEEKLISDTNRISARLLAP
jgi:cytosine/adenosine deaminase-related metal-dependent hydrolase